MKVSIAVATGVALLAGIASANPISFLSTLAHASKHSVRQANSSFAKASGRLFNIDGKGTSYFAGTNAWYLSHLTSNDDVDEILQLMSEAQLKVARVWGFGSVNTDPGQYTVYFQLLNSTGSYINYGANGLPRLDYVVRSAERHGVKLVLPFVNNWSDLGGIASYNAAFGGNATTWYTDAKSQQVYKDYIKLIVNRYKNSTAIFAWELANEPRCHGCPTSVITNWATGISKYIKSLDPNHMVTLGDEGWFASADGIGDGSYGYSGSEGVDWVANLKIPDLDYGTLHLYPDSWGYNYSWGSTWIKQHDQVGATVGKPVVLEEYGGGTAGNHTASESPWQQTVLKDTSIAMDQFWQFGYSKTSNMCDALCVFPNDTDYAVLVKEHAAAMLAKKV